MKCVFALAFSLCAQIASSQLAVPTKAVFVVSDDLGCPVTNALVDGGFANVSQSGARDRFDGLTDSSGKFVASGHAVLDVGARFRKQGYYQTISISPLDLKQKKKMNRWDIEVPVLLKPIKHPVPMCIRGVETGEILKTSKDRINRYVLNSRVGYDLREGGMTSPYGSGKVVDLEFLWKMDIHAMDSDGSAVDYDTLCEIRMTNVVDGICKGIPGGSENGQTGSALISDYEAPLSGYTNLFSFSRKVRPTKRESTDDGHYLYYFRIRTQTNDLGQVTNAFYGKIYGRLNLGFTYYLNPTPNDRNVEHDPKTNLFKDK